MFFPMRAKCQWHMYRIMVLLRYLKPPKDGLFDPRGSSVNKVWSCAIEHYRASQSMLWLPFTNEMASIYTGNGDNHKYNCLLDHHSQTCLKWVTSCVHLQDKFRILKFYISYTETFTKLKLFEILFKAFFKHWNFPDLWY